MLFNTDILDLGMAETIANLSFSDMSEEERLRLADHCVNTRTGLYHCLNFLGDSLATFAGHNVLEFTPTSLCQLGCSLITISSLIPTLEKLEQQIRADIDAIEPEATYICL